MPVTIEAIAASLDAIGDRNPTAASSKPYYTDITYGFTTTLRDNATALIAAMVVYFEDADLAFLAITDNQYNAANVSLDAAIDARRALDDGADTANSDQAVALARREKRDAEFRNNIRKNIDSLAAAHTWSNLVGCHQVSRLGLKNIKAYFEMKRAGEPMELLVNMIDYWANQVPGLKESQAFINQATNNDFVMYHTRASANGALILQANMSSPCEGFFSAGELAAAVHSDEHPTDMSLARNIPKLALVKTYAILEALDALPTNKWYMGIKAKASYPAATYETLVKSITRHQVAINRETVGAADSTSEQIAASIQRLVGLMDPDGIITTATPPAIMPGQGAGDDDDDEDDGGAGDDGDDGPGGGGGDGGTGGGGNEDSDEDDEEGDDDGDGGSISASDAVDKAGSGDGPKSTGDHGGPTEDDPEDIVEGKIRTRGGSKRGASGKTAGVSNKRSRK